MHNAQTNPLHLSERSIISEGSRRTEQWFTDARRRSEDERWPNSDVVGVPVRNGVHACHVLKSEAPLVKVREASRKVGLIQGGTRPCAYGKPKKVRPPMMNVGDELGPRDVPCARSVVGSAVSSQRSSVYRAAVLEAQAETQRALAGLASTRAECNGQHQAVTSIIMAVQQSVQGGLQVSDQLRTAQNLQGAWVRTMC